MEEVLPTYIRLVWLAVRHHKQIGTQNCDNKCPNEGWDNTDWTWDLVREGTDKVENEVRLSESGAIDFVKEIKRCFEGSESRYHTVGV